MVFRKRGKLTNDEVWTYGGNTFDAVDDCNYLGPSFIILVTFLETQNLLLGNRSKLT